MAGERKRGAATGTRTRDLDVGNVALYLLSYNRVRAVGQDRTGHLARTGARST
jgi:hypothetical protein